MILVFEIQGYLKPSLLFRLSTNSWKDLFLIKIFSDLKILNKFEIFQIPTRSTSKPTSFSLWKESGMFVLRCRNQKNKDGGLAVLIVRTEEYGFILSSLTYGDAGKFFILNKGESDETVPFHKLQLVYQ